MLRPQISSLKERELSIIEDIKGIEIELANAKSELAVIRKARTQMEKLQKQLGGTLDEETNLFEQRVDES